MKSLTAVCQTGASMPAINPNGRISRHPHHRGDGESAEMKMYLSKLKDLVPFMPKNRKLSKLEIIQHVIDYICDLQSELETHPEISNFDAAAALNFTTNLDRVPSGNDRDDDDNEDDNEEDEIIYDDVQERLNGISQQQEQQQQQQQQQHQSSPTQRQPLVDRQTPNTILPATQQTTTNHQQVMVSAVNNTSVTQTNTSTYSAANNTNNTSNTTVSSSSSTTTTTIVTTNLSHTLSNEKPVDNSSRQFC